MDSQTPWWRDYPWILQIDAERWSYDDVQPSTVLAFADRVATSGLPGWKVTYASRGQYGDSLMGIATPLWNADYRGGTTYPGDGWTVANGSPAGWAPYSGQVPVLLQWTSGPDLNAYRGSLDELLTLTGGTVAFLDDPNAAALAWRMDALQKGLDNVAGGPVEGETMWLVQAVKQRPIGRRRPVNPRAGTGGPSCAQGGTAGSRGSGRNREGRERRRFQADAGLTPPPPEPSAPGRNRNRPGRRDIFGSTVRYGQCGRGSASRGRSCTGGTA
jgi:hypothetical protein